MTNPIINVVYDNTNSTRSLREGTTTITAESLNDTPSMKIVTHGEDLTRATGGDKCLFNVFQVGLNDYDSNSIVTMKPITGDITDFMNQQISCDVESDGTYDGDLTDPNPDGNPTFPRYATVNSVKDVVYGLNKGGTTGVTAANAITPDMISSNFVAYDGTTPAHCAVRVEGKTCDKLNFIINDGGTPPVNLAALMNTVGGTINSTSGSTTISAPTANSTDSTIECGAAGNKVDVPFDFGDFTFVPSGIAPACQTNPGFGACSHPKLTFNTTVGDNGTELLFGGCPVSATKCCNHPVSISPDNNGTFTVAPVCNTNLSGDYCLSWNISNVSAA